MSSLPFVWDAFIFCLFCFFSQTEKPWWRVDLGRSVVVKEVQVHLRTNCCLDNSSLKNAHVLVATQEGKESTCGWLSGSQIEGQVSIMCNAPSFGRYVTIMGSRPNGTLTLCEIRVLNTGILGGY